MIVTVLWRNEGSPKAKYTGFEDVNSDKYYFEAVSWAFDNNIHGSLRQIVRDQQMQIRIG